MQKIDIRKDLNHGDKITIAQMTGFSYEYVKKVLDPADKRYNDVIMEVAQRVVEMRRMLKNEIKPRKTTTKAA